MKRRTFLISSVAATAIAGCKDTPTDDTGASPSSPVRDPEPTADWEVEPTTDPAVFPWPLVTGDATADGVRLGLYHLSEAEPRFVFAIGDGEDWVEVEPSLSDEGELGAHRLAVTGLQADAVYRVYATVDGVRTGISRFRTALAADQDRRLVFGATSCLGYTNPEFPSLAFVQDYALDAMLMLGDTVYADGSVTLDDYRQEYKLMFARDNAESMLRSASVIATWDDHEVLNNWLPEDLAEGQFEAALQAFREAQPQGTGPGGTGIWRRIAFGTSAEVFVLDCRGERDGQDYISPEQLDWLLDALQDSAAHFKIILNSVPITDLDALFGSFGDEDRWQGYPTQREALLSGIEERGIEHVLWIAGDLHYGAINFVGAAGDVGADQYEIMVGPAGSFVNPAPDLYDGNDQYPFLTSEWNWVRLELDALAGTVNVRFIGDDGAVFHEVDLVP